MGHVAAHDDVALKRHETVTVLGEQRTLVVCVWVGQDGSGNWNVEKQRLQKNVEHHSKEKTGNSDEGTYGCQDGVGGQFHMTSTVTCCMYKTCVAWLCRSVRGEMVRKDPAPILGYA